MDQAHDDDPEFTEWLLKAQLPLSNAIRRSARSAGATDDILQDVVLQLVRKRQDFATYEDLLHYGRHIARWRVFDLLRRQWREGLRRQSADYDLRLEAGDASHRDAEAQLVARDEFVEQLAKLPPRGREVVVRTLQGQDSEQIGVELGISPATVRSLIRRARFQLASQSTESDE